MTAQAKAKKKDGKQPPVRKIEIPGPTWKQFNVRLPVSMKADIVGIASQLGITASSMLRMIIKEGISGYREKLEDYVLFSDRGYDEWVHKLELGGEKIDGEWHFKKNGEWVPEDDYDNEDFLETPYAQHKQAEREFEFNPEHEEEEA